MDYSASIAEIGHNAGPDTWNAAMADCMQYEMLSDSEEIAEFKSDVEEYGAWSEEEIAGWSDQECNALFVQFISAELREKGDMDWDEYEKQSEAGQVSGRLYHSEGETYYYVGS